MQPFRRLKVWQKAHELSVACHRATFRRGVRSSPGLRAQLLRAADAIAANIAEGAGQFSQLQFARFLEIALASAHELDNHLELAAAIAILDPREAKQLQELTWEVKRMLTGLHRAVKKSIESDPLPALPDA